MVPGTLPKPDNQCRVEHDQLKSFLEAYPTRELAIQALASHLDRHQATDVAEELVARWICEGYMMQYSEELRRAIETPSDEAEEDSEDEVE